MDALRIAPDAVLETALSTPAARPAVKAATGDGRDAGLHRVCTEFEALLTAQMLKRAVASAHRAWQGDDTTTSRSSSQYLDMVSTQLARYVGEQGLLGVADDLYSQLSGHDAPRNMSETERNHVQPSRRPD